jgi:FkbM family methyltransferase
VALEEMSSSVGYEPWALPYFLELCRPGMSVVDIGASWGAYALPAAQRVGPEGRVWAVEASAQNCRTLTRSAGASGVDNLTILPFGASDALGCRPMPRQPVTDNNNAIAWDAAPAPGELDDYDLVPMMPLDLIRAQFGAVALVKMDIEGMEYRAARGALELLREQRPVVFCEYSPTFQQQGSGVDGAALLRLFADLGYSFEILHRAGPREPVVTADAIERVEAAWRAHVADGIGTHLDLCLKP